MKLIDYDFRRRFKILITLMIPGIKYQMKEDVISKWYLESGHSGWSAPEFKEYYLCYNNKSFLRARDSIAAELILGPAELSRLYFNGSINFHYSPKYYTTSVIPFVELLLDYSNLERRETTGL